MLWGHIEKSPSIVLVGALHLLLSDSFFLGQPAPALKGSNTKICNLKNETHQSKHCNEEEINKYCIQCQFYQVLYNLKKENKQFDFFLVFLWLVGLVFVLNKVSLQIASHKAELLLFLLSSYCVSVEHLHNVRIEEIWFHSYRQSYLRSACSTHRRTEDS